MAKLLEASSADLNIFHRTGHRSMTPTDMQAHVEKLKTGFIPQGGDMYGKGLYGADWGTQVKGSDNMLHYGPIIIHYVSKPKGYMIFDYRLAKRLLGGNYTLEDQLIAMGAFNAANLPVFLRVLSDDLEDTLKYPRISADRAFHLAEWFYKGKDIKKEFNNLKYSPVPSIKQSYEQSYSTLNRNIFNGKINSGIIKGLVFAGNHDGNVIVTFPPAFKKLIFVGWCCAEKGKITKPWDYDGGSITADGMNGQYQDGIGELLVNNANKSVVGIKWATNNLNQNAVASAIKTTLKSLEWLKHPTARYKDLDIVVNEKGETTILSGKWIMGDCFATNFNGDFIGGKFVGTNFDGNFFGGLFCKGTFLGKFSGGIYFINKDTKWDNSATALKNRKSINVDGKVYEWTIADTPDKEWKRIQSLQKARATGSSEEIDNLEEFIVTKLGYQCRLSIDSKWEARLSNEQKFIKFKQKYDWLFKVRKLTQAEIVLEDNGELRLLKGELIVGTVRFDFYGQQVVIKGGQVMGKNTFVGKFMGGIYDEGKFDGTFCNGIFNLDKAVWSNSAKMKVPIKFDDKHLLAVIYKGKLFKIPIEVMLYNNKKYQNFIEISKVFTSNKWKELVFAAKKDHSKLKGAFRSDDEELELDADEQNVPDWAVDIDGINAAGIYARESFEDKTMLGIMYEDYVNREYSIEKEMTMFNESFGYWIDGDELRESEQQGDSLHEEILSEDNQNENLIEKEFNIYGLSDLEQDMLYQEFKNSYVKATGAAFSLSAFSSRADAWTFLGDPPDEKNPNAPIGGIAIRKQPSGLIKLVGSFGDIRSTFKGFSELKQRYGSQCVWGFVTENIKRLILKRDKDFVTLPGSVIFVMQSMIKKLSNGEVKSVGLDGSITVDTPAGVMKKYMIVNKNYIRWLIDAVENPANANRIPIPQIALIPLMAGVKKLL